MGQLASSKSHAEEEEEEELDGWNAQPAATISLRDLRCRLRSTGTRAQKVEVIAALRPVVEHEEGPVMEPSITEARPNT